MRDYRVLDGLFFSADDRALLRDRIQNTKAGADFVKALEQVLAKEDTVEFPRLRMDWYTYPADLDHALSVEIYQNYTGIVAPFLQNMASRARLRTLAVELLDKTEYRGSIRTDMLRFPAEYPLHLIIMPDTGLALYGFLRDFLFVLDAERHLFTEEEQWRLDSFARGVTMDILYNHEEWLRSKVGQQHCNNHLVAHSQAAVAVGLYYHRQDWVEYGLRNVEGIFTYLEDGMSDPGMGIEASLTYNLNTLNMMMETAEPLRRAGHPVDLYHRVNARGGSLRDFFSTAVDCLAPNGRIIPIGDCYARTTYFCDMEVFFRACVAYGDEIPGLLWLAHRSTINTVSLYRLRMGDIADAEKPVTSSALYENYGLAILKSREGRTYWDSDAKTLAVRTGYSRIHGNADHMAMLLFSGATYLLRDFEGKDTLSKHAFSGHITRTLNRSRLAHNAVMIDGQDSRNPSGTLQTEWERGDSWQKLSITDNERVLYEGVWQKRTLTLYDDRLIDTYEVVCDDAHDIDYLIHIGDSDHHPPFEKNEALLEKWFPNAWPSETLAWMLDPVELDAQNGIAAAHPGIALSIRAEGAEKGLSFHLPEADDLSMGASHSYLLRVHGKTARFEAAYRF